MFGIMLDSDMELKLQLSRAIGVWKISRLRISERDASPAMAKVHGSIAAINESLDKLQSLISSLAKGKEEVDTRRTEDRQIVVAT